MSDRIADLERQLREANRAQRLASKHPRDEPGGALYFAVGMAIRETREGMGISQAELAQSVGLQRTSIVNIEGGNQRLPLTTLYDIADALGVQAVALLPRNEDV